MVARLNVVNLGTRTWVAFLMVIALAAVFLVGPAAGRSDAATISVANETQFRSALTTLSANTSGSHRIEITADFTVTEGALDPYYSGTRDLVIDGNGHTITGQLGDQVGFIFFDSSAWLTVGAITVTGFTGLGWGGAVYTDIGNVTIVDSTFSYNTAPEASGSFGGAVYTSTGDIIVANSTFDHNTTLTTMFASGGALYSDTGAVYAYSSIFDANSATGDFATSGAIFAGDHVEIADSSFTLNFASGGAFPGYAGAVAAAGSAGGNVVSGSLFSNNTASSTDMDAIGGATYFVGSAGVENSTFVANAATSVNDTSFAGAIAGEAAVSLTHVTFSANAAANGGAQVYTLTGASFMSFGSIFTSPLGADNCGFGSGTGTSSGHNFIGDSTCFTLGGTDISGSDPQLNALADNGGPTMTMEPASDTSPVVDAIPVASGMLGFDQRGVSRPRGANCDIGAVELLVADSGIIRLAGENRYGTAAAISAHHHPFGAATVFVSTGLNFPDALAGAAAAAGPGAPLVLTGATIPAETYDELDRLLPTDLVILGGTGVVSSAIETALGAYGATTRLASTDRYATAVAISQYSFPTTSDVVLVAVGSNFADALAGGPAAAKLNGPVLLTATNAVPQVVLDEIARLDPSTIIVLGGTGVVSDAAYNQLVPLAPSTIRLFGDSRYETAVAISEYAFPDASLVNSVYVADGSNFPDALAGAAEAAAKGVPILLTTSTNLPSVVADEIDRLTVDTIYILGGTGVVSPTVATQLLAHLVV